MSAQTISMAYLTALLDAMEVTRGEARNLLAEVGIAPGLLDQPAARVTESQFARLYKTLANRLDDEMPRLFSRPLRVGSLKITGISLLDGKNLLGALYRWAIVLRLLQDDFELDIHVGPDLTRIALVQPEGAQPCKPLALDLMLKLIHGVASWLVVKKLPLTQVDFSFPRPPFAADYQELYPGPVLFDQEVSALHLDSAFMQLPVRRTRPDLVAFVHRAPEDWVFASFKEELLSLKLRDYLAAQLPMSATAESAADALHVSVRTLHRRLADEGTSFQKIKDALRRDLAVQMLTRGRSPIASIGAHLGFDSTASFHRAFRGWTGDTPGAYREGHRQVRSNGYAMEPSP